MNLDILCNDGSPLGVTPKDIYGEGNRGIGVGGSEYALLTMCETWAKRGYKVRLYNNPSLIYQHSFEQLPISAFDINESRDVIIAFRSPNQRAVVAKGLKVWWSCDQYTIGDFATFAPTMQRIVCISPFHQNYFRHTYKINNAISIDLPVRLDDFKDIELQRVPCRMVFTSVPDRGLPNLWRMWGRIKHEVPSASLVITSDYRLWGINQNIEQHRVQWMYSNDVSYLGGVKRDRLVQEQLQAELLVYPCGYEELFCISCAEAQVAGVYPITSGVGALGTTNLGTIVLGNPQDSSFKNAFIDEISSLCADPGKLLARRNNVQQLALARFDPEHIANIWDEKVFNL